MANQTTSLLSGFRELLDYLPRRRRFQMLAVFGLMLVGAIAELVTIGAVLPFLALLADPAAARKHAALAKLLAVLGVGAGRSPLVPAAIVFCSIAGIATFIRITLAWASQKLVFRIGFDLGTGLYQRVLYQPYSFHVAENSSRILSGINKVQAVLNSMLLPLVQGITSGIIGLFIIGGLITVNAGIALVAALGFTLIYLGVSLATRVRLRDNSAIISRSNTLRTKAVQEGLGGIRDVLLDSAQPVYLRNFARIDTELRDAQATNALITATPRFVVEGLGMIMIVVMALVLNRGPGGLSSTLPVLGALALGAQRLLPLLQQSYNGWTSVMSNRATFFDVLSLLRQPLPADHALRHKAKPIPFTRDLTLNDVGFRYTPDGPLILDGIKLQIPRGSRVGFIGKTGSGKSTIMDLIMGLLHPDRGTIEVDGRPLDAANVFGWQVQLAHVPQHIYLTDGSFADNVAFGVPPAKIDHARVVEACEKADIHEFIAAQPLGYETQVGERGVRLSGGQRQRVGIARALYKRSTVLILDEATSALDDATEASIVQAVERLGPELTVLMIAHRLSTLRDCDVIYRIDKGRLVQQGTYEEVVGHGLHQKLTG